MLTKMMQQQRHLARWRQGRGQRGTQRQRRRQTVEVGVNVKVKVNGSANLLIDVS
jgi:hypothetical protein